MDIIRSHIHQFVSIHNTLKIRRQRLRTHYLPTGQPLMPYHYPHNVRNDQEPVDIRFLAELESEVKDFDHDEYLPAVTISIYAQLLSAGGFPIEFIYSDVRHKAAYLFWREKATDYLNQGGEISLFKRYRDIDSRMRVDDTDEENQSEEDQNRMANMRGEEMEEELGQLRVKRDLPQICESAGEEEYEEEYDGTNHSYVLDL
ncbi:hypothetical protein B9Z19DRAFT_1127024 [Tuber borchii]|uniref:Uncharacterized protein n=1 Tax=Tuber borchii TaxID=42251 RepID=A0A2T6ZS47_TUBBO|nr:hypothetical protein B9Z19DRAFT_1127024 [Tuber borchii]